VRSRTVTLSNNQFNVLPQTLDGNTFFSVGDGGRPNSNFVYPLTADSSVFTATTGTFIYPVTADDTFFTPWTYKGRVEEIIVGQTLDPIKGPCTILFSPSGLQATYSSISKIIYDFGDGTSQVVSRIINPKYTIGSPTSAGDPNTINVTHDYFPISSTSVTVFNPTVTVFYSNLVKSVITLTISATPLSIYDLEDVHLINTVQETNKTTTQNILEIAAPNYLTVGRIISAVDTSYNRVSSFNPNTALSGYKHNLILWLDAADGPTLQKNSSNNVLKWQDKSSYATDFYSGNFSPLYQTERETKSGRRAVYIKNNATLYAPACSAFDSIFTGPNTSTQSYGYSVFFVGHLNKVSGTVFSYDINDGAAAYIPNLNISFDTTQSLTVEQGHVPGDVQSIYQPTTISGISYNLSGYSLYSVTLSSDNNSWQNGMNDTGALSAYAIIQADTLLVRRKQQNYKFNIDQNYASNSLKSIIQIGASNAYPGRNLVNMEISEILVFNTPLNDVARSTVSKYLVDKWSLSLRSD